MTKTIYNNLPLDKKILYRLLYDDEDEKTISNMIKLHNNIKERKRIIKMLVRAMITNVDFKDMVRVGGPKGSTGSRDFTKGKCAFTRPCTVGWMSQNQPLQRGAGNRTPL